MYVYVYELYNFLLWDIPSVPKKAECLIFITLILKNIALISSDKTLSSEKNDTKDHLISIDSTTVFLKHSPVRIFLNPRELFTAGIHCSCP